MSVHAHAPRRIDVLLAEYGESHQNPTNKAIHWFAVPVIYYLTLSVPLAIGMAAFSLIAIAIVRLVEDTLSIKLEWIAGVLFVFAWVFQFAGHEVEGKKPSFLKDLQFLLIGPAWLMHFLFRRLNIPY